jgi:Domain of unknown function (DUF4160)
MYFDEEFHPGQPHFHAEYAGSKASFAIADLERLSGSLPGRVERLVKAWARDRRDDLLENWRRARDHRPLQQIDPLQN